MVKIGVVGLGRFGKLHAKTLHGLPEAELVALVARRQASLDEVAETFPTVNGWLDLDHAILESDAEAWVVACTTSQHVAVAKKLLAAGKHVLLEKPISDDLAEAAELGQLVRSGASNLMLGHIVLFNSEFQQLREQVTKRGPISYIDSVRHRPASIVRDFPGENPLHAAMVHDLYMVQVLMECQEPIEFSCQYHRAENGAIDLSLAQLRWESGQVASFAASYLTPDGMAPRGYDRTEAFGEGWACRIEPNPRPLTVWDNDSASWPFALEILSSPPAGMMAEELRCFIRVVQGQAGVPRGARYEDGMQVQRWMDQLTAVAVG